MLPPPNPATPDCPRAASALLERLDGSLGAGDAVWLERHLTRCPDCRRLQAGLAADARRLTIERSAVLPEAHVAAILAAIERSATGVQSSGSPAAQRRNRRDAKRPRRAFAEARPEQSSIPELHSRQRSPAWLASAAALLLVGLASAGVWLLRDSPRPDLLAATDRPLAPAPAAQALSALRTQPDGSEQRGAPQAGAELQGASREPLASAARADGSSADARPATDGSVPADLGPLALAAAAPLEILGDGSARGDSSASDSAFDSAPVAEPEAAPAPALASAGIEPNSGGRPEFAPTADELAQSAPDEGALEAPLEDHSRLEPLATLLAELEALTPLAAPVEGGLVPAARVEDEPLAAALSEDDAAAAEAQLTALAAPELSAIGGETLAALAAASLEPASAEQAGGESSGDVPGDGPLQRTSADPDLAEAPPSVSGNAAEGLPLDPPTSVLGPGPIAVARGPQGAPAGRSANASSSRAAPVSLAREPGGWRLSTQGDARQVVPALLDLLADREPEVRELAQARLLSLAQSFGDWPLGQGASEDWWNSLDSTRARERRGTALETLPDEAAWRRWWELRSSLLGAATH